VSTRETKSPARSDPVLLFRSQIYVESYRRVSEAKPAVKAE
jgi:hypothetical protein